jgi:hypothetical protein
MRIHTSATMADVQMAGAVARVTFTVLTEHRSRSRDRAFEVILSGESRRRQNGGSEYAATWDQWGVFLARLFTVDPRMHCWAYRDAEDFARKTDGRFGFPREYAADGVLERKFMTTGWPEDAHGDHSWNGRTCRKCSAEMVLS